MESVSAMEVKFLWGNYFFDHIISEASGNSGGILCAWDTNFFKKDHHTISDNFIALYGTWIPNNQKLLIISVYAPQSVSSKRMLWSYLESLITSWNGESLIMGDFNEVRCIEERWGSVFNSHGANAFNSFISNSGLNDIQLEGFSFTWAHPSATKMSKLDRFLMSNGLLSAFPLISAICLDLFVIAQSVFRSKERLIRRWVMMDLFFAKENIICIKTSQTENILESFKLIVKGKVFWARANELFVWSLSFKDVPEKELFSDDESAKINEQANNLNNDEVENASEVVSDTYFGDNSEVQGFEHQHGESNDKEVSSDPFNIYNLLDKRTKEVRTTDTSTSIPYPSGFTPTNDIPACNNQDIPKAESDRPPSRSARSNSRVLEEAENSVDRVSSESFSNGVKIKEGGSIFIGFFSHFGYLSGSLPLRPLPIYSRSLFDFGPSPFRFFITLGLSFLDLMTWSQKFWDSFTLDDSNVYDFGFKKSFQMLKKDDSSMDLWISKGIRWDYLDDVLISFGFIPKWRSWIRGRGPLDPFWFYSLMESLHLSFSRAEQSLRRNFFKWHSRGVIGMIALGQNGLRCWLLRNWRVGKSLVSVASQSGGSSFQVDYGATFLMITLIGPEFISAFTWLEMVQAFGKDLWIGDNLLKLSFPRLFALERIKTFGVFQVKDVSIYVSEAFLLKWKFPRWIKSIPIKVNVFAWKLYLDRLPTRSNLSRRNVLLPSLACPLCDHVLEDSSHFFFGCSVAKDIQKLIYRWWNLDVHPYESYEDWALLGFQIYPFSPSVGLSGGILCVWNPNVFAKESVTVSDSFVAVRGTWISSSLKLMFVSVYAPQDISERKSLWDYIKHMINLWDGECIILGDFNEVRSENERFGTIFNDIGAKAFNHFISSSCLIDLPLEGYSFTWALKSGSKMSKLDRFLISEGLISIFPSLAAICLDRRLSDHRPILLRESSVDYGPTPFRVFHSWFTKDGFDNLIADTWNNLSIMETNKISLLRKKFQALKAIIKNWSRDEMLKASAVRHSAQSRISELDKLIDKGLSNNDIINERISLLKDIHDLDKRHSSDLAQKAKIQWAIEGDENSKYFHGIINKKRSQLAIRGVLVDGEWIEDPPKVKNEFLEHFSNRFSMPTGQTINLDSHMFQKISIDQNADLESDVSLEEIKKAVWECGTNKSPGPDGFSFEFIRKYWNIIQHDVVNAVKEFFSSSKFPPGSNSSFITLIPKSLDAKMVKDFRPISLIGSFYKIVAKILSNRLCIVMPDLISDVQTAFISKRQILDGPFILNELISWCKYHKIKAMIFKADFEKAFDSVRWDYLDGVLNNFGFGVKWRGWIQACLSSAMGSILVNGSPSSEFKFHKGLKQGDPLSPFLFILVMESLHISFNNILNSGLYKGIRIDESLTLSHLFYADDAVFIGKWDKANVITIVNMLKCFYLASGLKINIQKSKIMGIGTSQEEVDVAANVIGCNTFSSPFNYLGVKVGSSSSRSNFWDEVIAKLSSRLSKWKIKMLSIGGRFTLNKAVLSSLPIYLMSIYKTPVGVLRKMESIRRRFFNGADINENKMSMIGWEKIMVSRKKGGLGISSFFAQNRALLFKWIWRFRSKDSSLWYRVIKAMFGDGGALDNTGKFARSSTWTTIVRECGNLSSKGINLLSHMKRKVGNGLNTLFWVDSWLTDIPLKQLYPRMFALDCNKNSTVAEKINASSISCSFRRLPRGSLEEEQFSKLIEDVNSVILSVSNDRWIWSLDSSGEFSIKSTRLFIDDHLLLAVGAPTRWVSEVPIKINIMAWKVSLDKLPTRLNLSLRGIEIPSITCPICSCAGESCSHLFFSCSMARNITTKLAR
ncbi:RNA-directed DNA polymerase, eukaryota [Tanacetum coccineum]